MALLKEGLWGIVQGTEVAPDAGEAAVMARFAGCQDKALAIIGLSIDPMLLYLLDGIDDPKEAWLKLHDQYCKKTWAKQLKLQKRLHLLRLREGCAGAYSADDRGVLRSGRDGFSTDGGG